MLPSNLALVLQYGSRPSSDFLDKILGIDTQSFLSNTQLILNFSHCYAVCLIRESVLEVSAVAHLVACLIVVQVAQVQFLERSFLNHDVCSVFASHKM